MGKKLSSLPSSRTSPKAILRPSIATQTGDRSMKRIAEAQEALARRLEATRQQLLDVYGSEQRAPW